MHRARAIRIAAILCITAQALAIAHISFSRHAICPIHGDLLDVTSAPSRFSAASRTVAKREVGVHLTKPAGTFRIEDHCQLAQLLAGSHVGHGQVALPPEHTSERVRLAESFARASIPPLELAPKQSPPSGRA